MRPLANDNPVAAVLRAALSLIKRGWCQGNSAVTKRGKPTNPGAHDAARWCIYGATIAAGTGNGMHRTEARLVLDATLRAAGELTDGKSIPDWNDHDDRSKIEVIRLFERVLQGKP